MRALPPGQTVNVYVPGNLPENVDYPNLFWRRKWWILLALVIGAAIGAVRVVLQPPVYKAYATIELLSLNEGFMPEGIAVGAIASNVQTQIRILMSSRLRSKTAERVSMELAPITPPAPDIFGRVRNKFGLLAKEPVELTKQGIQLAASSLNARGLGATRLVEISCESISPDIATAFLNAHSSEYIAQYSQLRSTNNSRTTQWLEGQLEEAKTRAEQADEKVREFVRSSGMAPVENPSFDGRLQQLQADLSAAQSDRIAKQTRLELVKSGDGAMVEDAGLRAMQDKLDQGIRRRAEMLLVYTPENPKVKQLNDQVNEAERILNREKSIFLRRLQTEYDIAVQRERSVKVAYSGQAGALTSQADKGSQYFMLKREAENAQQTYNTLLQQLNQASMAYSAPNSTVRIIDPPASSQVPSKPQPPRDIALAAVLAAALVGGSFAGHAILRAKKMSLVVATPGHSPNLLDLPELGVIPSFDLPAPTGARRFLPAPMQKIGNGRLPAGSEELVGRELVMRYDKPSVAAESFRFTLTSLFGRSGTDAKGVYVISSAGPGEGKTTLASNLALAIAEMGKSVLLLDADMRKSRLHHVFGVNEGPGLREMIITDELVAEIRLDEYVQPTEVPGVTLLTAGCESSDSAATLLFSKRVASLLERLRGEYDVVLIDTAPAMYFADSRLLGRLSDGVILVMRSGFTPREAIMSVRQRYLADHIPIAGTILNDWAAPSSTSKYYDSYHQNYYKK